MGRLSDAEKVFSKIYADNVWGKGSGIGSEPSATGAYIAMLQDFLCQHEIRSVVDFGCGDWQFSQLIDWTGVRYFGFDVVASVIEANQRTFGADSISFHVAEVGARLPAADLVLCKDVLQHLPSSEVRRHLVMFKSLYPHILITNDVFPEGNLNLDIEAGQCRPLRLDCAPFDEPLEVALTWEINAYGSHAIKQTAHLRGAERGRRSFVELIDPTGALAAAPVSGPAPAAAPAALGRSGGLRAAIARVPILGPLARSLWRRLRRSM